MKLQSSGTSANVLSPKLSKYVNNTIQLSPWGGGGEEWTWHCTAFVNQTRRWTWMELHAELELFCKFMGGKVKVTVNWIWFAWWARALRRIWTRVLKCLVPQGLIYDHKKTFSKWAHLSNLYNANAKLTSDAHPGQPCSSQSFTGITIECTSPRSKSVAITFFPNRTRFVSVQPKKRFFVFHLHAHSRALSRRRRQRHSAEKNYHSPYGADDML